MSSNPLNGKHLAADIEFIPTPPPAPDRFATSEDVGVKITKVSASEPPIVLFDQADGQW